MALEKERIDQVRLVAYDPFGERRGVVPGWAEIEWTTVLNSIPTLKASISGIDTLSANRVEPPCELALEIYYKGRWIEPYNGRFITLRVEHDLKDTTQLIKISALGIGQVLRWATVWEHSKDNKDYKRVFNAQPVGQILTTLFTSAMSRVDATGNRWCKNQLTWDFTNDRDSFGFGWGKYASATFSPSDTLEKVINWFASKGAIDWAFLGRELYVATSGREFSRLNKNTVLHTDLSSAIPVTISLEQVATVAKFRGDQGYTRIKESPDAITSLGRIERWSEQGQVVRDATADLYLDQILTAGKKPAKQWRREWVDDGQCPQFPIDYRLGDWVSNGSSETLRVVEAGLKIKPGEPIKGWETLGTRLESLLEKLARHTTDLSSGMVGSDSGRPAPAEAVAVRPMPPTGLVADSRVVTYENGQYRSIISAHWDPVRQATNGSSVTVDSYQVYWRFADSTGWLRAGDTAETRLEFATSPDRVVEIRVRAVSDQALVSGFSAPFSLLTGQDTDPPPVPSKPVVSAKLGVIHAKWDGFSVDGAKMPPDFSHLQVYVGVSARPDKPTANVAAAGKGEWVYPVDPGTYYVGFKTVDAAGNESAWSQTVQVTVEPLVDTTEIESTLSEARNEIATARQEIETAKQYTNQAKQDLATAKQDIETNRTKLAEISKDISATMAEASKLRTDLNSKTKITRSNQDPSGTGNQGDLWLKVDGTGGVVAQWVWSADRWQEAPIRSEAITNLTVDKLTAGTGSFDGAVISKLVADKVFAQRVVAEQVAVTSSNMVRDSGFTRQDFWPGGVLYDDPKKPWLKITHSGGGAFIVNAPEGQILVSQGQDFFANCNVLNNGVPGQDAPANSIGIAVRYKLADGKTVVREILNTAPVKYGAWTHVSGPVVTPDGAISATFSCVVKSTAPPGSYMFMTPVMRARADNKLIVEGAITADKLTTGAVTADKIAADAITADMITAGKGVFQTATIERLVSDFAFADKLVAHKVLIGGPNLVRDPQFTKPKFWSAEGGICRFSGNPDTDPWMRMTVSDNSSVSVYNLPGDSIPVSPGEKYYASFEAKRLRDTAASNSVYVGLKVRKKDGSLAWPTVYAAKVDSSWSATSGEMDIPDDAVSATFYVAVPTRSPAGTYLFRNPVLKLKTGSDLIVDGAVSARHIAALSISADKLAANSVTADKITAGAISAQHIKAGAITGKHLTADAIDGMVITGATIQSAKTGERMLISGERLYQYDSANTLRFYQNASSSTWYSADGHGRLSVSGDTSSNFRGRVEIEFRNKDTDKTYKKPAGIFMTSSDEAGQNNPYGYPALVISGPEVKANATGRGEITLGAGARWDIQNAWAAPHNLAWIHGEAGVVGITAKTLCFAKPGGYNGHPTLQFNYLTPGTAAYTLTLDAWGWCAVSSSASRYKLGSKPNENDPNKILTLTPKTWFDKHEFDRFNEARERVETFKLLGKEPPDIEDKERVDAGIRRVPGLIAEEVEQAGLKEFVQYGKHGEVHGIYYDRLWTLLIPICRDLKTRLELAETELADVKKQLLRVKGGNQ